MSEVNRNTRKSVGVLVKSTHRTLASHVSSVELDQDVFLQVCCHLSVKDILSLRRVSLSHHDFQARVIMFVSPIDIQVVLRIYELQILMAIRRR